MEGQGRSRARHRVWAPMPEGDLQVAGREAEHVYCGADCCVQSDF
jgi:hypothetical protein